MRKNLGRDYIPTVQERKLVLVPVVDDVVLTAAVVLVAVYSDVRRRYEKMEKEVLDN